jgi:hypothetical protein
MTLCPAPAVLQQHARELARAFGVRLLETPDIKPDDAFARADLRVAVCVPIIDETTYAVALHEIGHLVSPTGALRAAGVPGAAANLKRDEEDAAWQWARHYALIWTPLMDSVARWAESTYAAPTRVPPPDRIDWTKHRRR